MADQKLRIGTIKTRYTRHYWDGSGRNGRWQCSKQTELWNTTWPKGSCTLKPILLPMCEKTFFSLFVPQTAETTIIRSFPKKKHPRKITSSKLLTKFCFCACVDALKATVGNSLRRYFNHLSTISLGTRSEE